MYISKISAFQKMIELQEQEINSLLEPSDNQKLDISQTSFRASIINKYNGNESNQEHDTGVPSEEGHVTKDIFDEDSYFSSNHQRVSQQMIQRDMANELNKIDTSFDQKHRLINFI